MRSRVIVAWTLMLLIGARANAQSADTPSPAEETRPATTTFYGDTGLWFVPTAEVLGSGQWSASAYRRGTNFVQGFANVGDFAGTFGLGIKDRAEIFGSFLFDTRVKRAIRPIFTADPTVGGMVDGYPYANTGWSGDNVGDLYIGAKVNLWSEFRQKPAAIALRAIVKAPTGNPSNGVSTGKADVAVDFILSKEAAKYVEMAAFAGYEVRGKPSGIASPGGAVRWGAGAAFPSRAPLRAVLEISGNIVSSDTATITTASIVGTDGSIPPSVSDVQNLTRATAGLTWQAKNGMFLGGGVSWSLPDKSRDGFVTTDSIGELRDFWDWQMRLGYHPGTRIYVPPPPPPPPPPLPPPPPPPAQVHNLTVKAQCDPCMVDVGKSSTVTATVTDSVSCSVMYRWSAPSGTLAQPAERQTLWTAGNQPGGVPVTVTVTCPMDNKTASDTVTIQIVPPPAKTYTFEDVHFDFDRYTLRPEATRMLDDAVGAMREDGTLKIQIEGHTCNIGTAEYNLALGDRRATAVKDYLVSRGVTADRLSTISYGEERPKYDNSREETRRLNRRAALVVNLTR